MASLNRTARRAAHSAGLSLSKLATIARDLDPVIAADVIRAIDNINRAMTMLKANACQNTHAQSENR